MRIKTKILSLFLTHIESEDRGCLRGKWLVKEPLEVENGYIKLPQKPGLGVELNMDAIAERPYKHRVPEAT